MPESLPQLRSPRAAVWLLSIGFALAVSATVPPGAPGAPGPAPDLTSVPPLPLLTSVPPPGAAAGPAPSGAPEPDAARAALHRAYRLDLVNLELKPPAFLNQDAASIIARDLQLGVTILVVTPGASHQGRPVLAPGARIDEKKQDPSSPFLLLCDGGHYSLLLPSEAPSERNGYYLLEEGVQKSFAEAVVDPGEGFGTPRRIPADGNCLITCLHFLKHGRFPDPAEIARLRGLVAEGLTEEQVADALGAMRSDLILNAAETAFEGGTFPGYGPLTSSLLQEADPEFTARRARVLEAEHKQAAETEYRLAREQAKRRDEAEAEAAAQWIHELEAREHSLKERAMVAAYRSCLLEAVSSSPLGPELAQDLAGALGDMYVPMAQVIPGAREGKPLIRITESINADEPDRSDSRCLLFQDGRFKVLERLPEGGGQQDAGYFSVEDEVHGYLELAFPGAGGARRTTVPADGNSLLNAMFAMQEDEFPSPSELAQLKAKLNRRLTGTRVLALLKQQRRQLIAQAAEQLSTGGGFPELQGGPGAGKAGPSAKRRFQPEEEEDPDLAWALALSLAPSDSGDPPATDGSRPLKQPRTQYRVL